VRRVKPVTWPQSRVVACARASRTQASCGLMANMTSSGTPVSSRCSHRRPSRPVIAWRPLSTRHDRTFRGSRPSAAFLRKRFVKPCTSRLRGNATDFTARRKLHRAGEVVFTRTGSSVIGDRALIGLVGSRHWLTERRSVSEFLSFIPARMP